MPSSLARQILDLHRVPPSGPRPAAGDEVELAVDHVAVGGAGAALVFLAFEATGVPRARPELVLACGERDGGVDLVDPADAIALGEAAARAGAVLSRAGNGRAHQVHAARYAQPGRVALGLEPSIGACGAFAMIGLTASEIEVAAALAGSPPVVRWPVVVGLELVGRPPEWFCGHDLALELQRLQSGVRGSHDLVELRGDALAALDLPQRLSAARLAPGLGVGRLLFPSDATTRRHLLALGREADWKVLAAEAGAEYDRTLTLDLGVTEPLVLRHGDARPAALRDHLGRRVHAVLVGPEAGAANLARMAGRMRGRHAATRWIVVLAPGRVRERLTRDGTIAVLLESGARIVESSSDLRAVLEPGDGAIVSHGFEPWPGPAELAGLGAGQVLAGIATCASSLVEGVLADPRRLDAGAAEMAGDSRVENEVLYAADEGLLVRPPAGAAGDAPRRAPRAPLTLGRPLEGPLRGVVLLGLGDGASGEQVLPWGARVRLHHAALDTLAEWSFAAVDPGFAARARAEGGGFIVAGHGFGDGPERPQPALVAARLGVRAVLARSFGAYFHRQLVLLGVLPLRFVVASDLDLVGRGDELEAPDLPDGLEPRKPLVIRNLTRGSQLALRHDLGAREIDIVLAGGLLRAVATAGRAA